MAHRRKVLKALCPDNCYAAAPYWYLDHFYLKTVVEATSAVRINLRWSPVSWGVVCNSDNRWHCVLCTLTLPGKVGGSDQSIYSSVDQIEEGTQSGQWLRGLTNSRRTLAQSLISDVTCSKRPAVRLFSGKPSHFVWRLASQKESFCQCTYFVEHVTPDQWEAQVLDFEHAESTLDWQMPGDPLYSGVDQTNGKREISLKISEVHYQWSV